MSAPFRILALFLLWTLTLPNVAVRAQAPAFAPIPASGYAPSSAPVSVSTPAGTPASTPVPPAPSPTPPLSSASPAARDPGPAGGPPAASTKKGLGIVARNDGVFANRLRLLNAKWFYSWGAGVPDGVPFGVDFVPMVWGWSDAPRQADFMRGLGDSVHARKYTTVLGFNEPDGKDQANMPVQKALEAWPQMMATGARLGSPAGIHADTPWMRDFMHGTDERKLRVDFITIHWYGDPNAAGFLGQVDHIHDLYHRPVWITEFCPADWGSGNGSRPNRFSAKQVQDFMRAVIPALKGRGYVERFAWFSPNAKDRTMGISALFNEDGTLTDLGKIYASY